MVPDEPVRHTSSCPLPRIIVRHKWLAYPPPSLSKGLLRKVIGRVLGLAAIGVFTFASSPAGPPFMPCCFHPVTGRPGAMPCCGHNASMECCKPHPRPQSNT